MYQMRTHEVARRQRAEQGQLACHNSRSDDTRQALCIMSG
jgi:hypothetical protein